MLSANDIQKHLGKSIAVYPFIFEGISDDHVRTIASNCINITASEWAYSIMNQDRMLLESIIDSQGIAKTVIKIEGRDTADIPRPF